MKFDILKYLEEEKRKEVEKAERDAYDGEYWLYNPNEDAGDRV